MNMSQNDKGSWQLDVTSEYPTPEESALNLAKAIDLARQVGHEKGLVVDYSSIITVPITERGGCG